MSEKEEVTPAEINDLLEKMRSLTKGHKLGAVANATAILLAECYCEAFEGEHDEPTRAAFLEETELTIESAISSILEMTTSTQRH